MHWRTAASRGTVFSGQPGRWFALAALALGLAGALPASAGRDFASSFATLAGDQFRSLLASVTGALLVAALIWQLARRHERRFADGRYRQMLGMAALGLCETEVSTGRFLWVNEKLCEITGYDVAELIGKSFRELTPVQDRESDWEAFQRCMLGPGRAYQTEKQYIRKDGSTIWVRVNASVHLRTRAGKPLRAVASIEDITDRKRTEDARRAAEEASRASEERLNQAVSVSKLGIFEHDLCTGAVHLSARMRQILGASADEVVTSDGLLGIVHPDDREKLEIRIRHARDPTGSGGFDVVYRILRSDGIAWLSTKAQTLFEGEGDSRRPVRTVGATLDITDQKRAEEALRISEERLNQAVRVSKLGIFEHDHRTGVIFWSATMQEIWGWTEETPRTVEEFLAFLHPDDREAVATAIRDSHDPAGDGLYNAEYRALRTDGTVRWIIARGQSFFEGEPGKRRLIRTLGAAMDITERREAEDALRREKEFSTIRR